MPGLEAYWSLAVDALLTRLDATPSGLTSGQVADRLARFGPNTLREQRLTWLGVPGNQIKSPLTLLLVFAATASAVTGEFATTTARALPLRTFAPVNTVFFRVASDACAARYSGCAPGPSCSEAAGSWNPC